MCYLGFDLSTQQLKVIAVDANSLKCIYEKAVHFDSDLPHFKTHGGAIAHADGLTVTVPTLLWVEAFDLLLQRMTDDKFPFHQVISVSGTGQQHGSVYWKNGVRLTLQSATASQPLAAVLAGAFSVPNSPIWMDSSTSKQCRQLEESVGGPEPLAQITGSRAYERFTGSQIAKIFQTSPELYEQTERVALVSSFLASLLIGDYAPIDYSDASGMNLFDIHSKIWDERLLHAAAPNLRAKLGQPVASQTIVGSISPYLQARYGFSSSCQVIACVGDNPASLAGMCLAKGDVAISLGTSDTVFIWLTDPNPSLTGHVFCNPCDPKAYMALLCYKNGSLQRESVRDRCANASWSHVQEALDRTNPGNDGQIGIFFNLMEITPAIVGTHRRDAGNNIVTESFSSDAEIRAVIESQFLAKRIHAEHIGFDLAHAQRVLLTGGASNNVGIQQIISNIFGASVHVLNQANSAALGCAYRAKHGTVANQTSYSQLLENVPEFRLAATPDLEAHNVYTELCKRYSALEEEIVKQQQSK